MLLLLFYVSVGFYECKGLEMLEYTWVTVMISNSCT